MLRYSVVVVLLAWLLGKSPRKVLTLFTATGLASPIMASLDTAGLAELIKNDQDIVNTKDEEGLTPLHLGVISGNTAAVKLFIRNNADLDSLDREGHSAVHWAVVCSQAEILKTLCESGAHTDTPDNQGAYPLHYATSAQDNTEILETFLEYHEDLNVTDKDGRTPLMWAASCGATSCVAVLLSRGADLAHRDKESLAAVHCAAAGGWGGVVEQLVGAGQDVVDMRDVSGSSPLFYAASSGHVECVATLLDLQSGLEVRDSEGRTAVFCAVSHSQLQSLELLETRGADMLVISSKGDTLIHEAVYRRDLPVLRYVLSHANKSLVNKVNCNNIAPLHMAAAIGDLKVCKELLDSGCYINHAIVSKQVTPLDIAISRGNKGCAKFLQLHGGVAYKDIKKSKYSAKTKDLLRAMSAPVIGDKDIPIYEKHRSNTARDNIKDVITPAMRAKIEFEASALSKLREDISELKAEFTKLQEMQVNLTPCRPVPSRAESADKASQSNLDIHLPFMEETCRSSAVENDSNYTLTPFQCSSRIQKSMESQTFWRDFNIPDSEQHKSNHGGLNNGYSSDEVDSTILTSSPPEKDSGFGEKFKLRLTNSDSSLYNHLQQDSVDCLHQHRKQISISNRPPTSQLTNIRRIVSNRPKTSAEARKSAVTQTVQKILRRYQVEKRIFQELLEMKKYQIRVGRSNEAVLVKRLAERFNKNLDRLVGLHVFKGDFTFTSFENHLYKELNRIQTATAEYIPRIKYSDDMDTVRKLLLQEDIDIQDLNLGNNIFDNPKMFSNSTENCKHSSSAFRASRGERNTNIVKQKNKKKIILPRIDNRRDHRKIYLKKETQYLEK